MRALIKNDKKIVISMVDSSERVLIDNFIKDGIKKETEYKLLYDIDNDLDGISFKLAEEKPYVIPFRNPGTQVLFAGSKTEVDLKVDEDVTISVNPSENHGYLETEVIDNIINITAIYKPELQGKSKQLIVTAILNKEDYETTIVPINVSIFYTYVSYETLGDLPSINDVTLVGNKTLEELDIQETIENISNEEIDEMI